MATDNEKLQGKWRFASMQVEGVVLPHSMFADAHMLIDGGTFTTVSSEAIYKGQLSTDMSVKPPTIDLQFTDGPEKGKISLGICTIDADTWTLCLAFAGKDRPKDFVSTAGSGHVLETLQRVK